MSRAVVLCVGNPYRRDDGVANAVAAQLRGSLRPVVEVVELDADPARIIDAWSGADLVIVVDAARARGSSAGAIHRIEVHEGLSSPGPAVSTHGHSLSDAVDLARALGRSPGRLVVYAVEGEDFGNGRELTEEVAAAVPEVSRRIQEEVQEVAPPRA